MNTGFCNNFKQGRAGTVKVYAGIIRFQIVDAFACIFFHVNAVEHYFFTSIAGLYFKKSFLANGCRMLAYLVTLRQVGVKIIFTGKIVVLCNAAIKCKAQANCELNHFLVHYRQRAGMRQ